MSRMAEQYQQEQQNESGMDLCEAWHEEQRRLLNEINEITETRIRRTAEPVLPV